MMSSSPSPAPIAVGRFELGPTDGAGSEAAAVLGAMLGAGAVDALGAVDAPFEHAATMMPRLAATANNDRDLMLLLLQMIRSRSCADASRSIERPSRSGRAHPSTMSRGSAGSRRAPTRLRA